MNEAYRFLKQCLFIGIGVTTVFLNLSVHPHELQENRASLVLRNDRQVNVTFYLNMSEVLQKTLTPTQDRFEHTAKLSAMNEGEFLKQYGITKNLIESSVIFRSASGKQLKITDWQWPEPRVMQKGLRDLTMQSVVGSGHHFHENPFEIRLHIQSTEPLESLTLELPVTLKPITLVASRPKQKRFDNSTTKVTINF